MSKPDPNVDRFNRAITLRHQAFLECLEKSLIAFTNTRMAESQRANEVRPLQIAGKDILNNLDDRYQPLWVKEISKAAEKYCNSPNQRTALDFLKTVQSYGAYVTTLDLSPKTTEFDFDALYKQMAEEERLPELFDELIKLTEQIIDSRQVHDMAVHEALTKLAAMLKANKNGSQAAVTSTVVFATFVKHYAIEYLRDTKIGKTAVVAWEKTVGEIESKKKKTDEDTAKATIHLVLDMPHLEHLRDLAGNSIPAEQMRLIVIEDASTHAEARSAAAEEIGD